MFYKTHLNHRNLRLEASGQLHKHLGYQMRMMQLLTHLHDAHNSRLDEHFTIFFNVLVCRLLLNFQFRFQRHVDVDSQFFAVNSDANDD